MREYEALLMDVLEHGVHKDDRTGTGTRSIFGRQIRFDLSKGFPLVTTKKLHTRSIIYELLWFLNGDTNIRYLNDNGVTIWDEWADDNGELGPIYGRQWRNFGADGLSYRTVRTVQWDENGEPFIEKLIEGTVEGSQGVDQIANLIETIKTNPDSRRMVVSAWNPIELPRMALPPCHCLWQVYVADGKLSLQLYQRSADIFLGVPFNIASYSLLAHMLAQQCGFEVGDFIWTGGDVHLYENHIEQATLQLSREPRPFPTLKILRKPNSIFEYRYEDFEFEGYDPWPSIKAPVAV